MTMGNLNKYLILALLMAFSASVALPGCSSNEESSDSNVSCDGDDTREECADDVF